MKTRIAARLTMYFALALLTFAIIVGFVFVSLFSSHAMKVYEQDMEQTAKRIAGTMSSFYSGESLLPERAQGQHGQGKGFGVYLKYLSDVAISDVWILDRASQQITCNMHIALDDLPEDVLSMIENCLTGQTVVSESFSGILGNASISVGTPIYQKESDEIAGVVLLHSPIKGVSNAMVDVFVILGLVLLLALIVVVFLAIRLSRRFTRPLLQINQIAAQLADGDYTVKTGVQSKDEIGQLANTIDTLSDRLYEASLEGQKLEQMRQDFVSNISHELRTPVTVIRGSLEAINDGVVDGEQKEEYLSVMFAESLHLERLVNDLLELSRLQNADFVIEKSVVNLYDVAADVIRSMKRIAEQKRILLEFEAMQTELLVMGDYGRLRQMVMVAVSNSVKFSPEGETVIVRLLSSALVVEDHGIGIKEEDLPRIFDRFHRSNAQNYSGTGLGLAIAKQIAIRHNIEIIVSSQPNIKTTVTFDLEKTKIQ